MALGLRSKFGMGIQTAQVLVSSSPLHRGVVGIVTFSAETVTEGERVNR